MCMCMCAFVCTNKQTIKMYSMYTKKNDYLTSYCSLQDTSSAVITPRSCACIQESSSHPQPLSTTALTLVPVSFV